MRVVFMGTPDFAVPVLDLLLREHEVAAVYTRPDAATGRGRKMVFSPVKQRALEAGVPLMQPRTLREACAAPELARYAPEMVVVAAYGLILPREVLDVPEHGCVNVHASLLPRWRGAAPVQRAILAGDETTGVSIMRMEEGLDTGPFALQVPVSVDDLDAEALTAAVAKAGAEALGEYLRAPRGRYPWIAQDDALATYADKVTAADVAPDPSAPALDVLRRVRASTRSAPSRVAIDGRRAVVLHASAAGTAPAPGLASCEGELVLGVADGGVRVDRLVPEGRAPMLGSDWLRGARLPATCTWGPA